MERLREGAQEIGDMLAAKQLKANSGKSKFVILGHQISRQIYKTKWKQILMGDNEIGISESEKYL